MKSVSSVLGTTSSDSRVIDRFTCKCGVKVELVQTPILGGPNKGEMMTYKRGTEFLGKMRIDCRCYEKEITHRVDEQQEREVVRQIEKDFNENSLINPDLKKASFTTFRRSQPGYTHEENESLNAAYLKATEYVKTFDIDSPRNLFFQGPFGNGKSHLAVCIARAIRNKGRSTVFISTPKMLSKIRSTYNKDSEQTESQLIAKIEKADLVVFDDIGAEGDKKGWGVQKLFELIDQRSGKHNIFTTNLTSNEFNETKDLQRIFSRLMMNTEAVVINAPDYRKRQFKKVSSDG